MMGTISGSDPGEPSKVVGKYLEHEASAAQRATGFGKEKKCLIDTELDATVARTNALLEPGPA